MDDPEDSYAPRSPDLSAFDNEQAEPEPLPPQHQKYRGSISHAPPQSPYAPPPNAYNPPAAGYTPPRNSIAFPTSTPMAAPHIKFEGEDGQHWSPLYSAPTTLKTETMEPGDLMDANGGMIKSEPREQAPGVAEGIEVKTKFPAARIKRIMQADEDVGKVAQVTPHVVGKPQPYPHLSLVATHIS